MELREIEVEGRTESGSTAMRRLRRNGYIPAVIYSEGKTAVTLQLSSYNYSHRITGSSSTQLFKFKSATRELDGLMALIKEVQHEPMKEKVLHVDFLALSEGHRITVTVPIKLVGQAEKVKTGDMILNQSLYELEVECLPIEIPDSVEVDISGLREGHPIHVRDIPLPSGAALVSDPDLTVVGLVAKAEEEATPVAAAAEGAPAAEGAAAAAGAAAPAAGAAAAPAGEKGKEKEKK